LGRAKDIRVKPISAQDANRIIRQLHYSGKVVQNSQLHLGVFLDGKCGGALQFGPSLDKRKIIGLVADTKWNEFLELNRLALADWLPRNSESRAIAVAMRLLRRHYPHLKWVVSFADGTQCGDGTIYRAAGFVLTGIRANATIMELDGEVFTDIGLRTGTERRTKARQIVAAKTPDNPNYPRPGGRYWSSYVQEQGIGRVLPGFQLRYIYFLDPACRAKLTVPELPYSAIEEAGAGMYKGKPRSCASSVVAAQPTHQ